MLEIWANLYGETGERKYSVLMSRYDRPRFFDLLLAGEDVLTNRHANTQIPEIHWWNAGTYRTIGTPDIRFVPLSDVTDGAYTVYFPVRNFS